MTSFIATIKRHRGMWIAIGSSLLTLVIVLVALNLTIGEKQVDHRVQRLYSAHDPQFARSMGVLLGPPIIDGNHVKALVNGDEAFPAMLSAIRQARRSITFETYIYWSGSIGREFAEALAERARAGVAVHVLLDWVGSIKMDERLLQQMEEAGAERAQMFSSSPTGGGESMQLMYLMAITAAARTIDLANAYFLPDELAIRALIAAARRGVRVRILTPGPVIDADIVRRASRARWGELLDAGVQIAEYQPTMFHVKALVVDTVMVSVGSTNFDSRSFSLNDEANLNVLDTAFARRQVEIFDADWKQSRVVTSAMWRARPWREKLLDRVASLLGKQL